MIALNKYFKAILFLFLLHSFLFAQDSLHIGLQIGVNQSSIYGIAFSLQWFMIKERGFIRINYDLGLAPIFRTLEGLSVKNGDRSKQRMRSWILFLGYEY